LRAAAKGGQSDPATVSLIIVYSLSKALGISPLEIYKMPSSLVLDLLNVHRVFEEIKAEEIEKASKKIKS
jgi:hypothetical protein|tara:strand:- start:536 stop:745 length:210 start_codon:yes stop_codon:yes gene_type:complete